MRTFFVFSDECGNYSETRSSKFKNKHPFYVRSTVMVESEEYRQFEKEVAGLKDSMRFPPNGEIKWAHIGDVRNGRPPMFLEGRTEEELKNYIRALLESAADMSSLRYIFTVTDNNTEVHIRYENIVAWHIQNALQRVQMDLKRHEDYGIIIIDDLDDKNKKINERCYQMMCAGDFVSYNNLKKSILVDYSHQCIGLQLADIVAGAFTNALIRQTRGAGFPFAGELYSEIITKNIRCAGTAGAMYVYSPYASIGYGLSAIPRGTCEDKLSGMEKIMMDKELERLFEC